VTGSDDFRSTAEEIITYVLGDLRTDAGLFASAQDADSEGEEGKYYLWSTDEMRSVLDEQSYALAREAFGLQEGGNFHEGFSQGLNIIHLSGDTASLAEKLDTSMDAVSGTIRRVLAELRTARMNRVEPFKDTKALTDWNGLMIAALAKAGAAFGRTDYVQAAAQAADFILETMFKGGRLRHVFMHGQARGEAGLDDYAFLTWGLIELYEATFEQRYLAAAVDLTSVITGHFKDSDTGGFFSTADDADVPIARVMTAYDNAVPSGNSVAMLNLLRLSGLTNDRSLRDRAEELGKTFSGQVERVPSAYVFMLCGLDYMSGPGMEVVIAGDPAKSDTRAMIQVLRSRFLPHAVVLFRPETGDRDHASEMDDKRPINGKATAYVCMASSCLEPTTSTAKLLEYLS